MGLAFMAGGYQILHSRRSEGGITLGASNTTVGQTEKEESSQYHSCTIWQHFKQSMARPVTPQPTRYPVLLQLELSRTNAPIPSAFLDSRT